MAYFAKISNGIVETVIAVHNNELLIDGVETESKGVDFCHNLFGGTWVQTSFNNRIRKQFAGIGYTYDADADEFICPQPFPSWTLDSNNDWNPPTPQPEGRYYWDEESLSWLAIPAG